MKMGWAICAGTAIFCGAFLAYADIGTMDPVRGATLLLPYFEADTVFNQAPYDPPEGRTVFSVTNASANPAIAHCMLFTDFGIGTVCFDVVLPRFGQQRIDLTEILGENSLGLGVDTPTGNASGSVTANALFQDGFETGDLSSWSKSEARISFDTLRAYHTGELASRTQRCAGFSYWDGLARGYVLIDAVRFEGAGFPDEPGYFVNGGNGIALNTNVLMGEYFIENDPNNFAFGNPLIAIEADSSDPRVTTPGHYTFYARYVGVSAADNREPLACTWQARNLTNIFSGGSFVLYWRDPKVVSSPLSYGALPNWYPLNQAALTVFDEDGQSQSPAGVRPFPLACGRVRMNSSDLPGSYDTGWLSVNFNNVNTGILSTTSQGVIAVTHDEWGRYAAGLYGLPTDNASDYNP